jgi:hypothetical protein
MRIFMSIFIRILGKKNEMITKVSVAVVRAFGICGLAIYSWKTFFTIAFSSVKITKAIVIAIVRAVLSNFLRNWAVKSNKISFTKTNTYVRITNTLSIIIYFFIRTVFINFFSFFKNN